MAGGIKHLFDLLVLTLPESDLKPCVAAFTGSIHQLDFGGRSWGAANAHAAAQSVDLFLGRHSLDLYMIDLGNLSSLCNRICKIAVITQQQQPFGVEIKTPHQFKAMANGDWDQIQRQRPALGIRR